MRKHRYQFYIDRQLWERAAEEAKKQHRTLPLFIANVLDEYLTRNSLGSAGMQPEGKADQKGQH